MMLRVRGGGLALRFRQAGASPAKPVDAGVDAGAVAKADEGSRKRRKRRAQPKEELLDGIKGAPRAVEEAPPEPSTEHVFTLRADQATVADSPISGIVKPLCGSARCPVVLDAEGISMASQVIALLGAAFPDGTPAPQVAWVLPPLD